MAIIQNDIEFPGVNIGFHLAHLHADTVRVRFIALLERNVGWTVTYEAVNAHGEAVEDEVLIDLPQSSLAVARQLTQPLMDALARKDIRSSFGKARN